MHCGLSENPVCICRINIQYCKYSINRIVCIFVLIIRSMFYLSNMLTYSICVERFSCSWTHALLTWGCLHCKWRCLLLLYINTTSFAWAILEWQNNFRQCYSAYKWFETLICEAQRSETSQAGFQRLFEFY